MMDIKEPFGSKSEKKQSLKADIPFGTTVVMEGDVDATGRKVEGRLEIVRGGLQGGTISGNAVVIAKDGRVVVENIEGPITVIAQQLVAQSSAGGLILGQLPPDARIEKMTVKRGGVGFIL